MTTSGAPLAVFVDYDGTITDIDTFDVLDRVYAGETQWRVRERDLEARLDDGTITLRAAMEVQASQVTGSLDEAAAILKDHVAFDSSFPHFAEMCRTANVPLTILSSGAKPLITRALRDHGVTDVPIVAADVDVGPSGWVLRYPDGSPNGIDKASYVSAARASGVRTVFIGDGRSDFAAALVADVRFAKRDNSLALYLARRGRAFIAFSTFAEVTQALFPA